MANTSSRSRFHSRSGVARRESLWFPIGDTTNTITSGSTAVLFNGLTTTLLALRPFTIVRTRGVFNVVSDQQAVGIENYGASFGMCVVSDQALAIGVTAVPTPETDKDSDLWFVFESQTGVIKSGGTNVESVELRSTEFDSKAMRKIEEGQDLAFVIETMSISSGVIIQKSGRVLIKLH